MMNRVKALAIAALAVASADMARAETVYRNDFSGSASIGSQTLSNGEATDLRGSSEFPTGPAAYFNGAGVRSLTLGALDLSTGGTIAFDFRLGSTEDLDGPVVFEQADGFEEDVSFGYSVDGGATFEELELFGVPIFGIPGTGTSNETGWNRYSYTLGAGVAGASTIFRFLQEGNSGPGSDQWAVDNLVVENAAVVAAVPEPGTWALMIVGFGAAGAALRRRSAKRDALATA